MLHQSSALSMGEHTVPMYPIRELGDRPALLRPDQTGPHSGRFVSFRFDDHRGFWSRIYELVKFSKFKVGMSVHVRRCCRSRNWQRTDAAGAAIPRLPLKMHGRSGEQPDCLNMD
jgi:hypothetical protein